MSTQKAVSINVNGRAYKAEFPAHRTLLEALRELGHFDVKCGCEKGDCGACAVLVDGEAVDSCLTLVWTVEGRSVTTLAGLGNAENPHPLQDAFAKRGAVQCGFCIPGIIVAGESMLRATDNPSEDDVRMALSGNLCRCTGYTKIVEAIMEVASLRRGASK